MYLLSAFLVFGSAFGQHLLGSTVLSKYMTCDLFCGQSTVPFPFSSMLFTKDLLTNYATLFYALLGHHH